MENRTDISQMRKNKLELEQKIALLLKEFTEANGAEVFFIHIRVKMEATSLVPTGYLVDTEIHVK